MWWAVAAAVVLLVVFVAVRKIRSSGDDFGELHEGFLRIQRNAFDHITTEDEGEGFTPPSLDLLDKISFQTSKRFSVVYTISREEGERYNHTVSGKPLTKQPRKRSVENMLFLMTVLTSQFEDAKFGEEVKFGLDESEVGTMYVGFSLNAGQQGVFEEVVLGRRVTRESPEPQEGGKIKARCPKCRAVYKIDESKIPDRGARARCTKCNESFLIKKD